MTFPPVPAPAPPVEVRPATPAQWQAVGEATAQVYQAEGLAGPDYLPRLADAASRARTATLLVAVPAAGGTGAAGPAGGDDAGDRVLGSVTFALAGTPYAEVAGPGEAEMRMLWVAPSARGRGIGRILTVACLDRAREAGAVRLVLSTQPVMAAAARLYGRLGFVRTPERDWSPGPGVDLLSYAVAL